MKSSKSIETASNSVRKLWEKHGIKEPLRFLGFCLSLLPVPIIQQAGQTLDRHLSDKAFEKQIEAIWNKIKKSNELVAKVDTLEQAIQEIAKTVTSDPTVSAEVNSFLSSLGNSQKEFSVLTENESRQEIINTLIYADISSFVAKSGSTNLIQGTTVNSEKTHLHSTDNSKNVVDRSTFQGTTGAVSMDGISTRGNISVQGSGIGFGLGSSISFGSNPNLVSGSCPFCQAQIKVDRTALAGFSKIRCPSCMRDVPFRLPKV